MTEVENCEVSVKHQDVIAEVKHVMPSDEYLNYISDLFKIFGDWTRTRILAALFNHELCVCDICEIVGMNKSAVSHQLRVLKDYFLVKARRQGKEVFYSLADEHVVLIYKMALEHVAEKREY